MSLILHKNRFLFVFFAAICMLATVAGSLAPCSAAELSAQQRLATELIRVSHSRAAAQPLTTDALDTAVILAELAAELDPENPRIWSSVLGLSLLAEREQLRDQAAERLTQLDPANEQARLLRLTAAIDAYQTVEERVAAYETLLREENIPRLGQPIASRLAYALALLHRRSGDEAQFSHWLSRSITLDPANRTALALATGFFRMRVQDAVGEAELLTTLMLADPVDITTQIVLGQLLLENGAYSGAERIYRLAVNSAEADHTSPSNNLLADYAIAQWARGNHQAALETLRKRQAEMDEAFRDMLRRQEPDMPALEVARARAPRDPMLATVRAAVLASRQDAAAHAAVEEALTSHKEILDSLEQSDTASPEQLAEANLQMAWVVVWLGDDLSKVRELVDAADALFPLSQQAKDRFEGWLAYRSGDLNRAIELLSPIAEVDQPARIGLGLALLQQGQTQEAAVAFLEANRAQPGSLLGIWAAHKLAELLGRRVPLSDEATRLEQLITSIPAALDRYPKEPAMALSLRVTPTKLNYQAYEPVLVDIEITNNSAFTLALDPNGPIRPQVLLVTAFRSASSLELPPIPFVVDVGRRLRLQPNESVMVTVDLRHHLAGDMLNLVAVDGTMIRVRALINFGLTGFGVAEPRLYGRDADGQVLRVDGARMTPQWMEQTIAMLSNPAQPETLTRMALLSNQLAAQTASGEVSAEMQELLTAARIAFEEAFSRLDGPSQAWILSVMPRRPQAQQLATVIAMARQSEHRLVKLAYLIYHLEGPSDPMLDAAKRGDDATLRRIAELIETEFRRAIEAERRQQDRW